MGILLDEFELLAKPGDTILETIEYYRMSQAELASRMGKRPSKINDLISGKEPITISTAFQLERVLGIKARFWLNSEMLYREKLMRLKQLEKLEAHKQWMNILPIKELVQYGFLCRSNSSAEMVKECLKFYGVVNPQQWEQVYIKKYLATNFRKSEAFQVQLGSVSAFLRIGEIGLRKLNLVPFDKTKFKETLGKVRGLVKKQPKDFAIQLVKLCSSAGVGIVYTPSFPKAPISGVARWIDKTPLIQLTGRHRFNDHFWFSFFHEAGHILLHGRKEIFLENWDDKQTDQQKENEADDFALKWLFLEDISKELPHRITPMMIRELAVKADTHPAVVLGYLQNQKKIPYRYQCDFRIKVNLEGHYHHNSLKNKGQNL